MHGFFKRHNRAITCVAVMAIGAHLGFSRKISLGILIGGIIPILYFDLMQCHSGIVASSNILKVRGRLFLGFLIRFGILALGFGVAFWISQETFLIAVIAFICLYVAQILSLSREMGLENSTNLNNCFVDFPEEVSGSEDGSEHD